MINFRLYSSYNNETDVFVLYHLGWNDWWQYETLYRLDYIDEENNSFIIGNLKIAQQNDMQITPDLPTIFNNLDTNFFSLGQDSEYYIRLNSLGEDIRENVLIALGDLAYNEERFKYVRQLNVVKRSLLRDISVFQVKTQFKKLSEGHVKLTEYHITYTSYSRSPDLNPPIKLTFDVDPNSQPPSNIHIIIGRNGVGKTYLLNNMINSLLESNPGVLKYGKFTNNEENYDLIFSHLVSVNFSAFDDNSINKDRKAKHGTLGYSYIGLKRPDQSGAIKSNTQLKNEFEKAIQICSRGAKHDRWRAALKELETDPVFSEADITSITTADNLETIKETASKVFGKLSSGHKIILLGITKLVATVEERTLVIMDEPETHLHPPLLSAYIRSLSSLLAKKNAVALIATHSPVVLQEVSNLCVWKLFRKGKISSIQRIEKNTFGENVGLLTHEVFGLEVTSSGFHKILENAVEEYNTFEEINDYFNGALGFEAQSIVQQLLFLKLKRNRLA